MKYIDLCSQAATEQISRATRFGDQGVRRLSGEEIAFNFEAHVEYRLENSLFSRTEHGVVQPGARDLTVRNHDDFLKAIQGVSHAEEKRRETVAELAGVVQQLSFPAFSTIGKFRDAPNSIYFTYQCGTCAGHGDVSCRGCSGARQVVCHYCSGDGRTRCTYCFGSGSIRAHQTVPDGRGGTRSVPTQVRCHQCSGGFNTCQVCRNSGRCACSQCSGTGREACTNCNATGALTDIATIQVGAVASFSFVKPNIPPPYLPIVEKLKDFQHLKDVGTPILSEVIQTGRSVKACYTVPFRASHQSLEMAGIATDWLFFAEPPIVLDAGHMLSKLLEKDSAELSQGDGSSIAVFLASEINAKILELERSGASAEAISEKLNKLVSAEYVTKTVGQVTLHVKNKLGVIKRRYLGIAALTCFPAMYLMMVAYVLLWSMVGHSQMPGLGFNTQNGAQYHASYFAQQPQHVTGSIFGLNHYLSVSLFSAIYTFCIGVHFSMQQQTWLSSQKSSALSDWAKAKGYTIKGQDLVLAVILTSLINYFAARYLPMWIDSNKLFGLIPCGYC